MRQEEECDSVAENNGHEKTSYARYTADDTYEVEKQRKQRKGSCFR